MRLSCGASFPRGYQVSFLLFAPLFFSPFFCSFHFKSFPLFDGTDSPLAADEEKYLIEFFGDDYKQYKARVGTGLPFIR